jgi:predicted Holliday junction resolvase-like endonuclease
VIALVIALALLALLVVVLAAAVVALSVHASRLRERLDDVKSQSAARAKDAVAKSRSVHIGKIVEKVAPLLPEFPYSPKDTYWLGGPIDVIVFHRLEAGGDVEVVLLEVKTGNAHVEVAQRPSGMPWRLAGYGLGCSGTGPMMSTFPTLKTMSSPMMSWSPRRSRPRSPCRVRRRT